jgi:diaminopimelate epimerase
VNSPEDHPSGPPSPLDGVVFTKGHGTENDFVLYLDPDGRLELTEDLAAWLCDRRAGLGGDGAIRAGQQAGRWFMDYRNQDGSLAEMCGNGIRVLVAYLIAEGQLDLPDGGTVEIATRGGVRQVRREGDQFAVQMGRWAKPALDIDAQPIVQVPGMDRPHVGTFITVPNPHVVVEVSALELKHLFLAVPPVVRPEPDGGANIEFACVQPFDPRTGEGRMRLRVFERGVGETKSCGTGVVASVAAAHAVRPGSPRTWRVEVPGGTLRVRMHDEDGTAELIGPAELVYKARLSPAAA